LIRFKQYAAAAMLASMSLDAQEPQNRPRLRVAHISRDVRIDGRLDEPEWAAADSIANLTQLEPVEGNSPTGRTVVRVLTTTDALIIGFQAYDPEPHRITSFARERDADLDSQDHIRIVLDTYLDGRSGYVFMLNPNGARFDALITGQGEDEDSNWDTVWEGATTRTASGWSGELRIPAKSLLFRTGLSEWGFNVQRRIQRLQETDRWATADRDVQINMMSRAGLLTGIPPFDLGFGSSIRPSLKAAAGIPAPGAPARSESDASLDVTQRVGANTLASLTVNTDFAETEVDTRRTNLTRFPLFFPEKRSFFLEGSDIFAFGLGTGDDIRPFFSRRIGLLNSQEVPLDAGTKINGRMGGTSYGALIVHTGDLDTLPTESTMGVVRVRQNVFEESSVGMIASFGDPLRRRDSWMAGTDLTYQTTRFLGDKNFLAGVWGLAMDRENLSGRRHALGGKLDYPNDLWDIALTHRWLGESFDPSLGFVPRPGAQITSFNVVFQPRPTHRILGLKVRQMFNEWENRLVSDLNGRWETYRIFTAPINWRLESGDRFEFNFAPEGDRLLVPFEIADNVTIPSGIYHWTRWRAEAGTASKRKLSGQGSWWFGRFYTGALDELELTASWKPSSLFIMELTGERNVGHLAEGSFTQDLVSARFRVNVSPDLQVNSYVQYDNESDSFGMNSRLRWSFSPQGDLFIVYNHNAIEPLDALGLRRGWRFASNQLLVKLQYAFRN
jgi:hypothetical protein